MKKTKYYAWMMAAALAMTGCSDEMEGPGGEGTTIEGVDGYVKVAINLPTASGMTTRAENDKFDDGTDNEYNVTGGIIAFFSGTTETSAGFVRAYNLGDLSAWVDDIETDPTPTDHVTTRHLLIQEAPMPAEGNKMYALVFLNPNGIISVDNGGLKIDAETYAAESGTTLVNMQKVLSGQDLNDYISNDEGKTKNSFFMCNSPLSLTAGGTTVSNPQVQTLVEVTVHASEDEANTSDDVDEIYVERAVGKVTLSGFEYNASATTNKYTITVADGIYKDDVVALDGWALDVTNKKTYVVRNISGYDVWASYSNPSSATVTNYNRFYGLSKVDGKDLYRIYWATDPNYTKAEQSATDNFTIITKDYTEWNTNAEQPNNDASFPLYCLENTMNAESSVSTTTSPITSETRVVLKTKYYFGNNANPTGEAQSFFMPLNNPAGKCMDENAFLEWLKPLTYSSLAIADDAEGGVYDTEDEVIKLFGLTDISGGETANQQAQKILGVTGEIKYYEDGTTFYEVARIQHFGDTYAMNPRDVRINETDRSQDANALGYYGVVRNNWYEINIASINGPGEPEIPEPSENDSPGYIRANINILSWAKRKQDVHL